MLICNVNMKQTKLWRKSKDTPTGLSHFTVQEVFFSQPVMDSREQQRARSQHTYTSVVHNYYHLCFFFWSSDWRWKYNTYLPPCI